MTAGNAEVRLDVQNEIYHSLRNQILSFEIQPGEMLSENMLSQQMDVSRVVVRDVLAQLAEEGYIVSYPRRGTVVTLLDSERIKQAMHAHVALEQAVIGEVCRKGLSDDLCKSLETIMEQQKVLDEARDILGLLKTEQQISYLLSAYCEREHIWDFFRVMESDLLRVNYLRYSNFNYKIHMASLTSWEHTQVEERMLLENLKRGDVEAAMLLCSSHANSVLWNMDMLRSMYPQYFRDGGY